MQFMYFLVILVVVLLVGYGILYFLGRKQSTTIDGLDQRKQELLAKSVNDNLYTLKNMNLSGQTKHTYDVWAANWHTITNQQIPEVEKKLSEAQEHTEKFNLIKARQETDMVNQQLNDIQEDIEEVEVAVQQLLESPKENKVAYEQMHNRYSEIRKELLSHSFAYGNATETLEKNLSLIELDLTKFNDLTGQGDYIEAREILNQIKEDSDQLKAKMEEIPGYIKLVDEEYKEQLEEINSGYKALANQGYIFPPAIDVEGEINNIHQIIMQTEAAIAEADLSEARKYMDKAERDIDSTYELLENEIEAKEFIARNQNTLHRHIDQALEANRYGIIEIDRISQSYLLDGTDMDKMQKYTGQLIDISDGLKQLEQAIKRNQIAHSQAQEKLSEFFKKVETIMASQTTMMDELTDLRNREKIAREKLDIFEMDMRNMKRQIEISHLPGISEEYLDRFFKAAEEIEKLASNLNRVKLNMEEIDKRILTIDEVLKSLNEETRATIDQANLTENMIQFANRYRPTHDKIAEAIDHVDYLFNDRFDYRQALETISQAVDQVEPGASERIKESYYQEK